MKAVDMVLIVTGCLSAFVAGANLILGNFWLAFALIASCIFNVAIAVIATMIEAEAQAECDRRNGEGV